MGAPLEYPRVSPTGAERRGIEAPIAGAVPAALWRNVLANEPAQRLSPTLCREMEARFDAPLDNVVVFRGPHSTALCAAVGARACAVNDIILFRMDEWRPTEPAGALLLAHELAHVLQQRNAGGGADDATPRIGAPDDPAEIEADVLASEAMGLGRRSPVSRQGAGVLRRALVFDPASATILVDIAGSAPGVDVSPARKLCILHLTRGASLFLPARGSVTAEMASAINLKGRVDVFYDNVGRDNFGELQGWRFRMRQITQIREMSAIYAGPDPGDGALSYDVALPPIAPPFAALSYTSDAVKSAHPYMNDSNEIFQPLPDGRLKLVNDMDDHPNWGLSLAVLNRHNRKYNLLFEATRDQEFVSAFVAVDKNNKATTLAYICWRAYWNVRCKWVGTDCRPTLLHRKFEVDKPVQGPPDDTELAALLTDLTADYAKTANGWTVPGDHARLVSDLGVQFMDVWPDSVHGDFYMAP